MKKLRYSTQYKKDLCTDFPLPEAAPQHTCQHIHQENDDD
jgi:hypothetical protein